MCIYSVIKYCCDRWGHAKHRSRRKDFLKICNELAAMASLEKIQARTVTSSLDFALDKLFNLHLKHKRNDFSGILLNSKAKVTQVLVNFLLAALAPAPAPQAAAAPPPPPPPIPLAAASAPAAPIQQPRLHDQPAAPAPSPQHADESQTGGLTQPQALNRKVLFFLACSRVPGMFLVVVACECTRLQQGFQTKDGL